QKRGGFLLDQFPRFFERYCDRATAALGDLIAYACTINEPEGLGEGGYILGVNPPGRKGDVAAMWRVVDHALEAHHLGAAAIRSPAHLPDGVTLPPPDLQCEDAAQPRARQAAINSRIG